MKYDNINTYTKEDIRDIKENNYMKIELFKDKYIFAYIDKVNYESENDGSTEIQVLVKFHIQ